MFNPIRVPEEENRETRQEALFEEIMAKFSSLMKTTDSHIQGAQQITNKIIIKENHPIYSVGETGKTTGKENILEATSQKKQIPDKQTDS